MSSEIQKIEKKNELGKNFLNDKELPQNIEAEQNVLGSIGVVGPTSMDYKRIISTVDYTAKMLSKTISEQSYD